MSKSFKLPSEEVNRNPNVAHPLDEDVLDGFLEAARNNQSSLALRYLSYILPVIDEFIAEARGNKAAAPAKKAPAKADAASASAE